jgi:hypothetical protein
MGQQVTDIHFGHLSMNEHQFSRYFLRPLVNSDWRSSEGRTDMTKTTKTSTSTLEYRWLKPLKDEPTPETTYGAIYQTMRRVKHGSLPEITKAAIKAGLKKFTDQDPTRMVRVHLRFMVNGGSVSQTRNAASTKKTTTHVKLVAAQQ